MLRPLYIIFIVLTAVVLKISFLNAASASNSSIIKKNSNELIFKVGKMRKREVTSFSKNQVLSMLEEAPAGKKEENEDIEKLFQKLRLSAIIFLMSAILYFKKSIFDSIIIFDFQSFFSTNLRTHLSFSIIRI